MKKQARIARDATVKGVLRSAGLGAALGAPVGAFAMHRQAKFEKKKQTPKAKKRALIAGAVMGGLFGASTNGYIYSRIGEGERFSPARLKRLKNYAKKEGIQIKGRHHPLIGSAAGGALGAGYGYASQKLENKHAPKKEKLDPLANAAMFGLAGAQLGGAIGSHSRKSGIGAASAEKYRQQRDKTMKYRVGRAARKWRRGWAGARAGASGAPPPPPRAAAVPEWLKGVTTKAEAKKRWRAKAYEHHPDRGGNEATFKDLSNQWSDFETHHFDKLSYIRMRSFVEEMLGICEA